MEKTEKGHTRTKKKRFKPSVPHTHPHPKTPCVCPTTTVFPLHGVCGIEVGKEVKAVDYMNYEFSGERWLAGSDFQVTLDDMDIDTPSLQADLGT